MRQRHFALFVAFIVGCPMAACPVPRDDSSSYGISARTAVEPYLNMPHQADGPMPRLLSETGAFADVRQLRPNRALLPYDLIVAFWSDGAVKSRWAAIPNSKVKFSNSGEWQFPAGTVFVKHFDLPVDDANPNVRRRLKTRLLVRDSTNGVYGVTYKWRGR